MFVCRKSLCTALVSGIPGFIMLLNVAEAAPNFPLTIENCGYQETFNDPPQRVITIGQHETELLLALGLEKTIKGTSVMAADHPLRQHADPLTESHLRQYPAINVEDSARKLTRRVAWRLSGQKEILVPDLETKIAAHLAGIGIGFLPAALCQPLIAQGVLLSRTIPTMRAPSPLSLAWRKDLSGSAVQEIVRLFHHSRQEIAGFLSPFNAAQYKEVGCCGSIINTV